MFAVALEGRRVLYISYNGMLDPLGQSQVIPYLRELTGDNQRRRRRFRLVTSENVGALVRNFSESEYSKAVTVVEQLAYQSEQTRTRNRRVAEKLFDVRRVGIERYSCLYERVLATDI